MQIRRIFYQEHQSREILKRKYYLSSKKNKNVRFDIYSIQSIAEKFKEYCNAQQDIYRQIITFLKHQIDVYKREYKKVKHLAVKTISNALIALNRPIKPYYSDMVYPFSIRFMKTGDIEYLKDQFILYPYRYN